VQSTGKEKNSPNNLKQRNQALLERERVAMKSFSGGFEVWKKREPRLELKRRIKLKQREYL
jgi:hypothetical protein